MIIDKALLVSATSRNHLNFKDLSEILNITPASFSRKIKNRRFTLIELQIIKERLGLNDKEMGLIFFSKES